MVPKKPALGLDLRVTDFSDKIRIKQKLGAKLRFDLKAIALKGHQIGQGGWIRTTDLLVPRQAGTARLPYTLMHWRAREDSNLHRPDS
jgi:hypothetical protein